MSRRQQGFLLLPVLLLLSMVAAAAYLTQRESQLSLASQAQQSDADQARAAAEAGLHRVAHEAHPSFPGCNGIIPNKESPITDDEFGGARYSAYASRRNGSAFDITSVGQAGTAVVTLTRERVVRHDRDPQTLVLQPGPTGQDTSLRRDSSSPEPDAITLTVQANASEALLRFDLSAIPEGSHVSAAQLSLRITDLQGMGRVSLHRIQSDWTEAATPATRDGLAPWVQPAGDAHPSAVATASTLGLGWMSWPITDLADGWLKGRWPNHGLLLRASTLRSLSLASSDYPTAALRPRLTITFHPPCGWDMPKQKQTLTPVADAVLTQASPSLNDGSSNVLKLFRNGSETRFAVMFDTSTIESSRNIKKATLRLHFDGLAANTPTPENAKLSVRRLTESWVESETTWQRRSAADAWDWGGGTFGAFTEETDTLPKGSQAGVWVEVDVKEWVAWWTGLVYSNQGLLVRLDGTEDGVFNFSSRESLLTPPELVIEYE